jgi:8-oxo-dGTP diphosphatase
MSPTVAPSAGGPPRTPLLTVDVVVVNAQDRVLLIRRGRPPFEGALALPGGFVDVGETVEAAARRELREETAVTVGKLTLVGVYSDPARDPRGHTCTVAYLARARSSAARAGDDAASVAWVKVTRTTPLAFDHRRIVADALTLRRRQSASAVSRVDGSG